ncbi:hypothetical protein L6452_15285 [Arctium lappa]|uniref:Uncharacterized protein n=1 Tax=Arctium lappa TaxID=4217 RepID=A0ACB9CN97_ARCLA|nr:hypothetical protein L6452_15285 [Arctium lappa]
MEFPELDSLRITIQRQQTVEEILRSEPRGMVPADYFSTQPRCKDTMRDDSDKDVELAEEDVVAKHEEIFVAEDIFEEMEANPMRRQRAKIFSCQDTTNIKAWIIKIHHCFWSL